MISTSLFHCCKKVFILMRIWITGENSIKRQYLKFLKSSKYQRYCRCRLHTLKREFLKTLQKKLGEYHDLHVQSNALLLADPFENFHNMCLDICELDPACFLTAPGLEFQRSLKKSKVRLDLLTDFDLLLMVEKGIREGIYQVIHSYAKANKKHKIL